MAHDLQIQYIQFLSEQLPQYFHHNRVLEIGSLDLNGTIRSFFRDCEYIGLDVASGPGVDVVCEGQNYDAPNDTFDVVICCEVMEHNPYWAETFKNMIRLCKPDGLLIMTCATIGRPEHGTDRSSPVDSPLTVELGWNYYKNLTQRDFKRATDLVSPFLTYKFWTDWNHYDLMFLGLKKYDQAETTNVKLVNGASHKWDQWLTNRNSQKVHTYRAYTAKLFGDPWFKFMNRIIDSMVWLHKLR